MKYLMDTFITIQEICVDGEQLNIGVGPCGFIITPERLTEIYEDLMHSYEIIGDEAIAEHNAARSDPDYRRRDEPIIRKPRGPQQGFVYLLQCGNHYKIGVTATPEKRMKQLMTQPPFEFVTLCMIHTSDMYGLEKQLHERYADKRVHGEWFKLEQEDVDYIISLSNGGGQ